MGYSTDASVAAGVLIAARDTLAIYQRDQLQTQSPLSSEHSSPSATTAAVASTSREDYIHWLETLCEEHKLPLMVEDTTRHEEYGCEDNEKPLWEREFVIVPRSDQHSWRRAKTLLQTEFWGHSAVASVCATLPLDQVRLSAEDRQHIDRLLQLLELRAETYPTVLALFHSGC